jgi:hypothetical protein
MIRVLPRGRSSSGPLLIRWPCGVDVTIIEPGGAGGEGSGHRTPGTSFVGRSWEARVPLLILMSLW